MSVTKTDIINKFALTNATDLLTNLQRAASEANVVYKSPPTDMISDLNAYRDKRQIINERVGQHLQKMHDLLERLNSCRRRNNNLEVDLAGHSASKSVCETEVKCLQAELGEIEPLKSQIAESNETIRDLRNKLETGSSENIKLAQDLADAIRSKETLEKTAPMLKRQIGELQLKIDTLQRELDSKVEPRQYNNAIEEAKRAQIALDKLKDLDNAKISELGQEIIVHTKIIDNLKAAVESNKQTIRDLTNTLEARDAEIKTHAEQLSQCAADEKIKELETRLSDSDRELDSMRSKMTELSDTLKLKELDVDKYKTDVARLLALIAETKLKYDGDYQKLQLESDAALRAEKARSEILEIQARDAKATAESERARVEAQTKLYDGEFKNAIVEKNTMRSELENARAELEKTRAELEKTRVEFEKTRAELEKTRVEFENYRSAIDTTRTLNNSEVLGLRSKIVDLERQLVQSTMELRDCKSNEQTCHDKEARIRALELELENKLDNVKPDDIENIAELTQHIDQLNEELNQLRRDSSRIAVVENEKDERIQQLESEIENLKRNIVDPVRITELNTTIAVLKQRIVELERADKVEYSILTPPSTPNIGPSAADVQKYIFDIYNRIPKQRNSRIQITRDDIQDTRDTTRLLDILRGLRTENRDAVHNIHRYQDMPRWYKQIMLEEVPKLPVTVKNKMYTVLNEVELDRLWERFHGS